MSGEPSGVVGDGSPTGEAVLWPNVWGETQEQARARRRAQTVLVAYLKSDLYQRIPTPDDQDGMTWESPLKWRVRISAPGPRVQIIDPRGSTYSDYVDEDGYQLSEVLP